MGHQEKTQTKMGYGGVCWARNRYYLTGLSDVFLAAGRWVDLKHFSVLL